MKATKQPANNAFPFLTIGASRGARGNAGRPDGGGAPSEDAVGHGVEESFPASDPVSVTVSKTAPAKA